MSGKEQPLIDNGTPIAYSALPKGVPVLSRSAVQFGTVEHVLQVPEEDLFDGIVISTRLGLRFVDRDQVDEITTTKVTCALNDEEVAALPEPAGTPVFHVDALQDSGESLHDRFGRMSGRPRWTRTE
jgi:hypothetical protein